MSIEQRFSVFPNPNPGSWPTHSGILASVPRRIGQRWGATQTLRCAANGTVGRKKTKKSKTAGKGVKKAEKPKTARKTAKKSGKRKTKPKAKKKKTPKS